MFHTRRILNGLIGLILALASLGLQPVAPVHALVLEVCPGCIFETIQSAVDYAVPHDEIRIAGGTYQGVSVMGGSTQVVYIDIPLTLIGGYNEDFTIQDPELYPTTIDAQGLGRVITVVGPGVVTLDGLRLINGNATGLASQMFDLPSGGCHWTSGYGSAGKGGGVCIENATLLIHNSVISNNTATTLGSEQGFGGGIYSAESTLTLLNSKVENNWGSTGNWWGHGSGIYVYKGSVEVDDNLIQNNNNVGVVDAGGIKLDLPTGVVKNNVILNNVGDGISDCSESTITLSNNRIEGNETGISLAGSVICTGTVAITANIIRSNSLTGIAMNYNARGQVANNVVSGNGTDGGEGAGIFLSHSITSPVMQFLHNTLVANLGYGGIYAWSGSANFVNTLIADHTTGVKSMPDLTPVISLTKTLFSGNTVNLDGAATQTGTIDGQADLAADGYHLTQTSDAVDAGVVTMLSLDIDGEPRLQLAAPDIGADESPFGSYILPMISFGKVAMTPQWIYRPAALGGGYLDQRYLLRFMYGSSETTPPALTSLQLTDNLPAELTLQAQNHTEGLEFTQNGQQLEWAASQPLQAGGEHWVQLSTRSTMGAGLSLHNTASASYYLSPGNSFTINASADTSTPLLAPIINKPGNGEFCPDDYMIRGLAQPNVEIHIKENGVHIATVNADSEGHFNYTYASSHAGIDSETQLTAEAVYGGNTSPVSNSVILTPPTSFWCPQRSGWTQSTEPSGNYLLGFRRSDGNFSATGWSFSALVLPLTVRIHACGCTNGEMVTQVRIKIGSQYFYDEDSISDLDNNWDFLISSPPYSGSGAIEAQCGSSTTWNASGGIIQLIDPDGYVFDSTLGFDPLNPTGNTIQDATVTAMAWLPEWGGWVPWPAEMYGQTNPQITDTITADGVTIAGYFAFFTPPGFYYIKAEDASGYQIWRSPVVEVVDDVIHVNVPLTPIPSTLSVRVNLIPAGISQSSVSLRVGQSVEWFSTLVEDSPGTDWITYTEDPILHLISSLNPIINPLGWDSGRLIPGQAYRRQFNQPGTYTYVDSNGHTGTVIVETALFLPLVQR